MTMNRSSHTNSFSDIAKEYLGADCKYNTLTKILFPHEHSSYQETIDKYTRRFERLYNSVKTDECIFMIVTRLYSLDEPEFTKMYNIIMNYNKLNKIIIFSGADYSYISAYENVTYYYVYYDPDKLFEFDYQYFRPSIKFILNDMTKL